MKANLSLAALSLISATAISGTALATETRLSIDVPKSAVAEAPLMELRHDGTTDLEFAASSWAPQSFDRYQSAGLPAVSITATREVFREGAGALSLKFGGSYSQLSRDSMIDYGGGAIAVNQRDHLLSAQLGLEYSHAVTGTFSPYFSASLLPTYSAIPRTAVADSTSAFGVPLEAGLGVTANLRAIGLDRMKLNLGGVVTSGNLGATPFYGIGALAGLRLSI